jgi:diacylglycerol kinase family enzyme
LNILVILNGISRKRNKFIHDYYPALQKEFQVELQPTEYSGHAEQLAAAAVHKDYDIIFAAGGDGTMSQVVPGLKLFPEHLQCHGFLSLEPDDIQTWSKVSDIHFDGIIRYCCF